MVALSLLAFAACSFDASTSGGQLEDGATATDARTNLADANDNQPDADLTPDADLSVDAAPPFVEPTPIANLVHALPHSSIVVDGVLDEWQDFSWVDVTSPADYRVLSGSAGNSSDLSARLAARWDAGNLYIAVLVTDDAYENNGSGEFIWQGDSMQVAFDVANNGGTPYDTTDDFEYGWARATGDTPASYRWIAPTGQPAFAVAPYNVIRTGTTTVYEVSFTPGDLGLTSFSAATGDIGFSWIVTEADGSGREGFLEWTSGVGFTKDPALFGTLRFQPDGP
jgi:hypothetical protein